MSKCLSYLIIVSLLILSSCKTFKKKRVETKKISLEEVNKKIDLRQFQFDALSAKSKVNASFNGNAQSFNVSFRIKKDSLIWLSASLLGIEGGRALISKDSIKILDRLNKNYVVKPFDYISKAYALPEMDFKTLQDLLVGNLMYYNPADATVKIDSGVYLVESKKSHYQNATKINPGSFDIVSTIIQDVVYDQAVTLQYHNYLDVDQQRFSHDRIIEASRGNAKSQININFTKVEVDKALSFPFNVSSKYKVIR